MINRVRFVTLTLIAALLQTCLIHRLSYQGLQPDLLFILAFYIGLKAPVRSVPPACAILGLARDLLSVQRMGVGMLGFVLTGAILVILRKRYFSEGALARAMTAFIVLMMMNLLYGAALAVFGSNVDMGYWLKASAGQALVTGALVPFACWFFDGSRFIPPSRDF